MDWRVVNPSPVGRPLRGVQFGAFVFLVLVLALVAFALVPSAMGAGD